MVKKYTNNDKTFSFNQTIFVCFLFTPLWSIGPQVVFAPFQVILSTVNFDSTDLSHADDNFCFLDDFGQATS